MENIIGIVFNELKKLRGNEKPIVYMITPTGCHECISHMPYTDGYHMVSRQSTRWRMPRYTWTLINGDIPAGQVVRHKCDNCKCINPDHLCLGTQGDNVRDMIERGRNVKGEASSNSVLTEAQVRFIRTSELSVSELAEKFGVTKTTIRDVRKRRTWKHVA
jgi:hypothetical protein